MKKYVDSFFNYNRRSTSEVTVGKLKMGSVHPIRIQSMANTNTNDIEASVAQCTQIIKAGGELVRFTTQGVREAKNLEQIRNELNKKKIETPLVADVHFNPNVADIAAGLVEKVRINPGNYVDSIHTFRHFEYTDEEYAGEIKKIRERFLPFLAICRKNNTAIRIGVNHGSLSDRIMSRYGNTAQGMVESCMEFLRICHETAFKNVVISIKSSNTLLMVQTVRLLIATMHSEGMSFPVHLGVTEAGDGEDGRIKSAVGIGALLLDGIGDTIRVSLTENPEEEIPVAKKLVEQILTRQQEVKIKIDENPHFNPFEYHRRQTILVNQKIGGTRPPVVLFDASEQAIPLFEKNATPDFIYCGKTINKKTELPCIIDSEKWKNEPNSFPLYKNLDFLTQKIRIDSLFFINLDYSQLDKTIVNCLKSTTNAVLFHEIVSIAETRAFFHLLLKENCTNPVILSYKKTTSDHETFQLSCGMFAGSFFLDGFGDGIMLGNQMSKNGQSILTTAFGVLQATRTRISKTEFVACPGCGRTLFDLQTTLSKVKAATSHLKNLKIAVMGCIVNGTGEMADADYGYVGAGKGKISLYKQHDCIEKNIPEENAIERLIALIKANGEWKEK